MVQPEKIQRRTYLLSRGKGLLLAGGGILVTLAVVAWLNLTWRPDMRSLPPDSGFYAYVGKAILHGQVLYRDLWDDKPPLGYYLNALAQASLGQTPWGVWWSGVIWISGCTLLLFFTIKKLFNGITSGIISILFLILLMHPELFQGSNLMEVFALAPQIGIIGTTFLFFNKNNKALFSFLTGVLTAIAYLIKQPTIALGCAAFGIMVIYSIRKWKLREASLIGLYFGLGCVGLIGLVAVYWFSIGALNTFIDGAIMQGFSFIGGTESRLSVNFFYGLINVLPKLYIGYLFLISLLVALLFLFEKLYVYWLKPVFRQGLNWLEWFLVAALIVLPMVIVRLLHGSHSKLIGLAAITCLALFVFVKHYRLKVKPINEEVFSSTEYPWLIGVVALPIEALMASLGARYFGHYFITMIPTICLVIAYPVWKLFTISKKKLKSKVTFVQFCISCIFVILVLIKTGDALIQEIPSNINTQNLAGLFNGQYIENDLERYIIQTTQPEDEVLVWHIHLGINFITDRKAPSRYLFPLNLFIPPAAGNTRLQEYVNELEAHPPELIVVQKFSSISLPFVNQPTEQLCQTYCTPEFVQAMAVPEISQQWERLEEFFYAHYKLGTRVDDWTVYRLLP
jgi:4-amino-4-deoxy-L-arabinose transferase-like glycosyltransferase